MQQDILCRARTYLTLLSVCLCFGWCVMACTGSQSSASEKADDAGQSPREGTPERNTQPPDTRGVPERPAVSPDVSSAPDSAETPDVAQTPDSRTPPERTRTESKTPDRGNPPERRAPDVPPKPRPGPTLAGCRIFPPDNPWNQDISKASVDPNSAKLIASIGLNTGLHPDFGTEWKGAPNGIPYVIVDAKQKTTKVQFQYKDESDPGPYPIPPNPPIEGGPQGTGDRHILVLQRQTCKLYELFNAFPLPGGGWKAGSGAIFDLSSNKLRPDTWTSADAAGLPILPGLVRYDEVMVKGVIRHALRFTIVRSRKAFVHPATHWASSRTSADLPPMGMRVRLKANYDLSSFPKPVKVILQALKTYGMFVADNGANWFVSGAPNPKWDNDDLRAIKRVKGKDFEVVKMGKIYTPKDFP